MPASHSDPAVERVDDRAAAGRDDGAVDRRGLAHGLGFERAEARLAERRDRAAGLAPWRSSMRASRSTNGRPSRCAMSAPTVDLPLPDSPTRTIASGIGAVAELGSERLAHRVDRRRDAQPELQAPPRLPQEDARPGGRGGPGRSRVAHEARRARAIDQVEHGEVGPQERRIDRALVAARSRRASRSRGGRRSRGRPARLAMLPSERRSIVTLPAAVSRSASSTARPAPPAPRTTACCTPVGAIVRMASTVAGRSVL